MRAHHNPSSQEKIQMPRIRAFRLPLAVALVVMAASGQSARAGLLTTLDVSTKAVPGGLTEYDYTLSNLPASTVTASSFFVAVETTADLTMLTAPSGWDISYATGDLAVAFTSPDPSVDILPGSSGLFSFDSPVTPNLAAYQVAGIDANGNFVVNNGVILSASVPEPATAALLAVGVLGVLGLQYRLKRRRPTSTTR
jgi:hypothetical protein